MHPSLHEQKFRSLMRHLNKIRPLEELAMIFRAFHGDPWAQAMVTIGEAELYTWDVHITFTTFLRINQLPVYEKVLKI